MGRQCIFCPNPANSLEHVWPDWILKSLRASLPIRHTIGKRTPVWVNNPEVKVRAVCKECNEGWMSSLEVLNKPLIGALIHDISTPIDTTQQTNLAVWTIKTAVVIDAINRSRTPFYGANERTALRTNSEVPQGTTIWLGRHSSSSFHAGGTDIWLDKGGIPKVAHGCVTTVIVGHLAIQSVTIHPLRAEYGTEAFKDVPIKPGHWGQLLRTVWPSSRTTSWPPPLTFTNSGHLSIASLMDRWKTGTKV